MTLTVAAGGTRGCKGETGKARGCPHPATPVSALGAFPVSDADAAGGWWVLAVCQAWRRAVGTDSLVHRGFSSARRVLVPPSPGEQLESSTAGISVRLFVSEGRALTCYVCRRVCFWGVWTYVFLTYSFWVVLNTILKILLFFLV